MRSFTSLLSASILVTETALAQCGPNDSAERAALELISNAAGDFIDCLKRAPFAEFVQSPKIFTVSDGPHRIMYNCFDADEGTYFVPQTAEFVATRRDLPDETGFSIMSSTVKSICWKVWAHPDTEGDVALIEGRIKVLQVTLQR